MTTTKLIASAVLALATSGGVAAAATGNLPTQSDDGRATAEEHTGFEVPASREDHPTRDEHPGRSDEAPAAPDDVVEVEADAAAVEPAEDTAEVQDEAPPADTHGAAVSEVAHDTETMGRAHGEAVSAAAQDNARNEHANQDHGRPQHAADGDHGRPDHAATPEAPEQATTPGTVNEHASEQGAEGAAHAEGRGRP